MLSFVRHSDRLKFFERTTCLHIRGLSMSIAALNRPKRNTWDFYSRLAALRQYQGFDDCFVDNRLTISKLVSY